MRKICLLASVVFLATTLVTAQNKISGTALCAPANPAYKLDVGDHPGHAFGLTQGKCKWTKPWEIAGAKNTEGVGTEYQDIAGDTAKVHGTYVDNMANGDKAFYNVQYTVVTKKDGPHVMNHKWELAGGTGKLKGVKGQGSCNAKPVGSDGSLSFECTGEYTLPKS